jgi:polyribonucleotide nucleotidyltransferase
MRTTAQRTDRKAKKSYTLSPESVAFLETLRKRRRAASISSVLEEILQAVRRQQERAGIEKSVSAYYSSLSDKEVLEQAQWGEFALREFPGES